MTREQIARLVQSEKLEQAELDRLQKKLKKPQRAKSKSKALVSNNV